MWRGRNASLVRALAILRTLERGTATAYDLAAEHRVTPRTIFRDLDALQQAGVPLVSEGGPGRGLRGVWGLVR